MPQVVAHRGSSGTHAEHTLGAYELALDEGADALECDVRLTRDGVLVCVHDRRIDRTSTGRGVVSTLELAELSELDFAAWKNPWADLDEEAPDFDDETGGVLTLRKLLEAVADYERPVEVAVETKHPTRYGGLVEKRLVELLRDFGWDVPGSPVRVMSFSNIALQRVERLAPDVRLVQLLDRASLWPVLRSVVGRTWAVGPGIQLLRDNPGLAGSIRRSGRDVHVWTVNTEADLDLCLAAGVSAVITDRPAYLQGLLDLREEAGQEGR